MKNFIKCNILLVYILFLYFAGYYLGYRHGLKQGYKSGYLKGKQEFAVYPYYEYGGIVICGHITGGISLGNSSSTNIIKNVNIYTNISQEVIRGLFILPNNDLIDKFKVDLREPAFKLDTY